MSIPSHIGQYRILRKIGAGGMGMVFVGEHMLLGRRAAIKTLLPTVAINQEIVERFFNEARAASAISHPGVVQIFDFGYHVDGTAYIVMELLEGESLSARIDRLGKLPLPDALRIARQIAGSLAAAHACGIVHRDLKPENIFLVRDQEAQGGERTKILDFGICKVGGSLDREDVTVTQTGAMVGTPVYMSPEQCRGTGDIDHRSDIYAFGCLLFHMLTGRPPFVSEASGELIVAHLQSDPPSPSLYIADLPFSVDALLLRCLAKSPEDRYQSMTELQLELGDIYAQLDVTESTVAAAPPAMQLGPGFRSVYDGNFSRFAGSSHLSPATHRLRPQLQFVSTPPPTPPDPPRRRSWSGSTRAGGTSDNDIETAEVLARLRPRHGTLRTLAAIALVGGVVAALAATTLVQRDDDPAAEAAAGPAVALPTERATAPLPPPPSSSSSSSSAPAPAEIAPPPASPAPAPAADEVAPAAAASVASDATRARAESRTSEPPHAAAPSHASEPPKVAAPEAPRTSATQPVTHPEQAPFATDGTARTVARESTLPITTLRTAPPSSEDDPTQKPAASGGAIESLGVVSTTPDGSDSLPGDRSKPGDTSEAADDVKATDSTKAPDGPKPETGPRGESPTGAPSAGAATVERTPRHETQAPDARPRKSRREAKSRPRPAPPPAKPSSPSEDLYDTR